MMTSCYSRLKLIPQDMVPVCISRGKPRWFTGRVCLDLAPTWDMLKMSMQQYNERFDAILAALDPEQVWNDLGENAVMLCWEPPNVSCHRRRVAEWLEDRLGVHIPELGIEPGELLAYKDMPEKQPKKQQRKSPPSLF